MVNPDDAIAAGRRIAGLIGYSPGPGIYSRMQRAVEAMPEMVRAEELPGLIRRHKEGVPGWEIKAVDLPSLYEGRSAVPREELLRAVQERSPLYTHGEVVLRGGPDDYPKSQADIEFPEFAGLFGPEPFDSRIGQGLPSGKTEYDQYSQGGDDYTEILLTQPGARHWVYGNHWDVADAVAHARFDRHGDALRINELQSDLGIRNRQLREQQAKISDAIGESDFIEYSSPDPSKPFPLEDAWADLLIKRLALEAARKGHRAIEVASPRAIADKVGGNIDNYEHFYGKVVPGALERLGRKMGGLTLDDSGAPAVRVAEENPAHAYHQTFRDQFRDATGEEQLGPNFWMLYSGMRYDSLPPSQREFTYDRFGGSHPVSQVEGGAPQEMYDYLSRLGLSPEQAQRITSQAIYLAPHNARDMHSLAVREQLESVGNLTRQPVTDNPRRYLMSDEMRRNILRNGIPASVLGAAALSNERQP